MIAFIFYLIVVLMTLAFFYSVGTLNKEYDKRIAALLEKENKNTDNVEEE